MGKRLVAYFTEADRLGGLTAKIRLAQETKVTSAQAAALDDEAALCARFEAALAGLRSDHRADAASAALGPQGTHPGTGYPNGPTSGTLTPPPPSSPPASASTTGRFDAVNVGAPAGSRGASEAQLLRRYLGAFLDLMSQRSLLLSSPADTMRRVTEAAAHTLDCARVSVWLTDEACSKISCADLYVRQGGQHSSGTELFAKDFPPYFAALRLERTIAAHDAHRDPRTACFSSSYLAPLGIGAMLDVPIWASSTMVGVLCHEHVGSARTWSVDEETTAYLLSNFVSLALERAPR